MQINNIPFYPKRLNTYYDNDPLVKLVQSDENISYLINRSELKLKHIVLHAIFKFLNQYQPRANGKYVYEQLHRCNNSILSIITELEDDHISTHSKHRQNFGTHVSLPNGLMNTTLSKPFPQFVFHRKNRFRAHTTVVPEHNPNFVDINVPQHIPFVGSNLNHHHSIFEDSRMKHAPIHDYQPKRKYLLQNIQQLF